jgi:hypothetical protein
VSGNGGLLVKVLEKVVSNYDREKSRCETDEREELGWEFTKKHCLDELFFGDICYIMDCFIN